MGYLYVMEVPKLKRCKVGISHYDPEFRKRSLQTGCPEKIERVWQSRNIPDYAEIEKLLHLRYASKNTSGEWFCVPFAELVEEAERLCRNGADAERIKELERENEMLREQINKSLSAEQIGNAILKILKQAAQS